MDKDYYLEISFYTGETTNKDEIIFLKIKIKKNI